MLVYINKPPNQYTGNIYTCLVKSQITEIVDAETKIDLLILTEIKKGEN